MARTEYHYPFELVKYKKRAFKKSFVLDLLSEATCCSCHKSLQECMCGSTEEESAKISRAITNVFETRRQFWKMYNGDVRDDQAMLDYAKQIVKSKEEKMRASSPTDPIEI